MMTAMPDREIDLVIAMLRFAHDKKLPHEDVRRACQAAIDCIELLRSDLLESAPSLQ